MKKIIIALTTIMISFFTEYGFTQETIKMEDIVVTATKLKESKKEISSSVKVITQEDIKNSTAKNVGDIIAEAGIGHIHKYPGALTSSIGVRGFRTDLFNPLKSRVLILINGHYAGTVNLAKIPIQDVERIEIFKGPASVIYGSSAMGGVINIITKKAHKVFLEKEKGIKGNIGGEVGSWEYWNIYAELVAKKYIGKDNSVDIYLSGSRSSRDDYKAKDYGKIKNTNYNDESFSLRIGYSLFQKDKDYFSIGIQHWRGWDIGSPGPRYSPDPDNYVNKKRNGIDISYEIDNFKVSYYYIKDTDEWHGGMKHGYGNSNITTNKKYSQGANIQNAFYLGKHRFIVGAQWDMLKSTSSKNTGAPYNPNSKYNTYGIYSEGKFNLLKDKVILNAGIRYDYFKNKILSTSGLSVIPKEENLDHITARGGLLYRLNEFINLKGNIGTAFRAPAPDELAANYTSTWGTKYIGNPNLKPEKSITYDIGIDYTKELLKTGITFFHTRFEDKILKYYDTSLSAMTWKNVDGAIMQGIEADFSYDIGLCLGLVFSIEPFFSITYMTRYSSKDDIEIAKYGKTLLYTPKYTGAFGIKAAADRWTLKLIANYIGDEKIIDWNPSSKTYGKTYVKEDFTVVNLKGSYKILKNLEITGAIENLFNRKYEYVAGYPMPQLQATVGVKWIF